MAKKQSSSRRRARRSARRRAACCATPARTIWRAAVIGARAAAVRRQLDPAEIDDVILGCAMPGGRAGHERRAHRGLRAGLPDSVPA